MDADRVLFTNNKAFLKVGKSETPLRGADHSVVVSISGNHVA